VKIFFLGTNGWFNTETGVTPCILIDSKEAYIVLDAGGGIYKLNQHITDTKKPIYLFISHLHISLFDIAPVSYKYFQIPRHNPPLLYLSGFNFFKIDELSHPILSELKLFRGIPDC